MAEIEVRDLDKVFVTASSSRDDVLALEGVTLEVGKGEIYCLLGPSGCGKSTVLSIIAGFEAATRGSVVVGGQQVTKPGPDRVVVFQQALLFPWLTVRKNVGFGPRLRGTKGADLQARVDVLLAKTGLEAFGDHYPHELSGGMQQRAALCRALVNDPEVILMDEPFGALDAQTRVSMQELLLQIAEDFGSTILFITHDVEEALFLGDRVGVMSRGPGRIVAEHEVKIARPRDYSATTHPSFVDLKRRILDQIHSSTSP